MADTKISALPASTTPLAGTEVLPIVQNSATKQVSVANLTAGRAVAMAGGSFTDNITQSTAAKGINFTANTPAAGMTSQLLNWYEEGTWTPVYKATGTFTAMTMDIQSAVYTRIGRQISVTAHIRTDNVNAAGASGAVYVDGLPFTCNYRAPVSIGIAEAWAGDYPSAGYIFPGTALFYLTYRTTANGTTSLLDVTDMTTGASADKNVIVLSAVYFI